MESQQPESAIVIPVPEAEALVGAWRMRYDPVAEHGVPAHVTLLYPFCPPNGIDEALVEDLARVVAGFEPFDFELNGVSRFPLITWLVPSPAERFIAITEAIVACFPEFPPYCGRFDDIVPHLTVIHGHDRPDEYPAVDAEFRRRIAGHLPLKARAGEVQLMVSNADQTWSVEAKLALGTRR
ncbi:MAG: 2'-5' RNA ligase family protein [Actinobacteria bacterium]|nr:MAG: 2'-5' RNA ligase family protein [Actinomycetota bacterium]RIK05996.1 MAG: hypothetical protein DCC48_08570 [Acidobacteriota bacterium]